MKIQIDSDCEGPISLNDNAFEICATFLPQGDKFFARVSRYDDYLAEIEKRPGYKGGDTLKLIIPFLLLFEVTREKVTCFSRESLVLLDDFELLVEVQREFPLFLISTSYREYALEVAKKIAVPEKNTYSTKVDWERYRLSEEERKKLNSFYKEILELPLIEIPTGSGSLADLPEDSQKTVHCMEEIFWQGVAALPVGKVFKEVNPVGGEEKARALINSQQKTGVPFENIIYFGDSITDKQALETARKRGGLAVAVNANRYALQVAEIAVLTPTVYPLTLVIQAFARGGKGEVLNLAKENKANWAEIVEENSIKKKFKVVDLKEVSWQDFYQTSESYRRKLRGEKIGSLG